MKHDVSNAITVVFNGVKFRRYPNSRRPALRNYFWPGISHAKRGVKSLHVEVWKSANGPVPEGHDIHHGDGDTLNNSPDNLECLTREEHQRKHFTNPQRLAIARKHIEDIRPLSKAWHKTEEGKAWHKEHGKALWENRERVELKCEECGEAFTTAMLDQARFCSNKCKAKNRRKSGVDNVERACTACGATFSVNRYEPTATCSRSCAYRSRKQVQSL